MWDGIKGSTRTLFNLHLIDWSSGLAELPGRARARRADSQGMLGIR
ncbi:MAG: hypothetical protein JRE20_07350 [Deltaproteobacteria bacterium]|nr:hypothetical protein [Deltaproteobacteria bacterium]